MKESPSEYDTQERSIPNPVHYLGSFLETVDCLGLTVPAATILAIATPFMVYNINEYQPPLDTEGTSMEASVMSDHRQAFSELKTTRILLDNAVAENATYSDLGVLSDEQKENTRTLIKQFSEQAKEATLDLYLQDIVIADTAEEKAGAAISEVNFDSVRQVLVRETNGYPNIQDSLGLNKLVAPAMLDECIIDTTFSQSNEEVDRYQGMTNLNQCMNQMAQKISNEDDDNILMSIISVPTAFLLGITLFGFVGEALEKTPKRIQLKPKRKTNKW